MKTVLSGRQPLKTRQSENKKMAKRGFGFFIQKDFGVDHWISPNEMIILKTQKQGL